MSFPLKHFTFIISFICMYDLYFTWVIVMTTSENQRE